MHHGSPIELFYSYSHEDEEFKTDMEITLATLKRDGFLNDWNDRKILPGQHINEEIKKHMDESDILVFLFSREFFASEACVEEWEYAKELESKGKPIVRIPVIVRVCPWLDFLDGDDVLALPQDGNAISRFTDQDVAWNQVYEGIKEVVKDIRTTIKPRQDHLATLTKTEAVGKSRDLIDLTDIFVFPKMTKLENGEDDQLRLVSIEQRDDLLKMDRIMIHGQEKSGKTALARFLYLSLIGDGQPVLLLNIPEAGQRVDERYIERNYTEQFSGDFRKWMRLDRKTLIIDDFEPSPRMFRLLDRVRDHFEKIIVIMSSDVFISYFKDEQRMNDFEQLKIEPMTHAQQEILIRKRLERSDISEPVTDAFVDRIENDVNSVIISNRIVPRYPFYVLSILQAYEHYMPINMVFTSSGHCYHALIVAHLIRTGLSRSGGDLDSAFNFLEELALRRYEIDRQGQANGFSFKEFKEDYNRRFTIRSSVLTRLSEGSHSIVDAEGKFRMNYVYYFFLGKILATDKPKFADIIAEMCDQSHVSSNHFTLLFIIHHSQDSTVIDHILEQTSLSFGEAGVATLSPEQTRRFHGFVSELPEEIASSLPVQNERTRERESMGESDLAELDVDGEDVDEEAEQIFRILKNNKVIGQVLRNKYGQMEKTKIEVVVETIVDGGLRLVNLALANEDITAAIAEIIAEANEDWSIEEIRRAVEFVMFGWTMLNLEQVVNAINVPEIREAVVSVVRKKNTPAYDLVGYFNTLNSASELTSRERNELRRLLRKHSDIFVTKVLSRYTQQYLNTHASDPLIEHSIYDLLRVRRVPRLLRGL